MLQDCKQSFCKFLFLLTTKFISGDFHRNPVKETAELVHSCRNQEGSKAKKSAFGTKKHLDVKITHMLCIRWEDKPQ